MDSLAVVRHPLYEEEFSDGGSVTIPGYAQIDALMKEILAFAPEGAGLTVWHSGVLRTQQTAERIAKIWMEERIIGTEGIPIAREAYLQLEAQNKSRRAETNARLLEKIDRWRGQPSQSRHRLLVLVTHGPTVEIFPVVLLTCLFDKALTPPVMAAKGCGIGINLETGADTRFTSAGSIY